MKKCTRCGEEKDPTEFFKDKQKSDGLSPQCKACKKSTVSKYYNANKEVVAAKQKAYAAGRKEKKAEYDKKYFNQNEEKITARKTAWQREDRKKNPEKYRKAKEIYRRSKGAKPRFMRTFLHLVAPKPLTEEKFSPFLVPKPKKPRTGRLKRTPEEEREHQRVRRASPVKFSSYENKIPATDKPHEEEGTGFLLVACKTCGKDIRPTASQAGNRMSAVNGKLKGENNFYCSKECKKACPLFNFSPERHRDPRLPLENDNARACQTKHLKQLQCDEKGHNYCEKCGDIVDVELHHTLPVAKYGNEAINSAGHMLLCLHCHDKLHAAC